MSTKFTVKRVASYFILVLFALLCILMLCFSTMYASKDASKFLYPDADNGFVWMSFESNIAYGSDWESFAVLLGTISIFQLIFGIVATVMVIINFCTGKPTRKNKGIIIVGFISMLLYAIEGIVYNKVYCNIMNYKSEYFATVAYIPLVIGLVLVAGLSLLEKFIKETQVTCSDVAISKSVPNIVQSNESDTIKNLAQYKELLDKGIITQEEFDLKKKQLLGL